MPTFKKIKTEAARSFLRDVVNENDIFHIFFGKTTPWDNESAPPTVTDTRETDANAHLDMMSVKRIVADDVTYLIPNVTWDADGELSSGLSQGTVYDRYVDDEDLSTLNFFVYNELNQCIYKCLNRKDYVDGNAGVSFPPAAVDGDYYTSGAYRWKLEGGTWGLVSQVRPDDVTGTEKFQTSDGYWWKMVYKISDVDLEKFGTDEYLPVRFIPSTIDFDVKGHIDSIEVTEGGTGYATAPAVIITGDGTGAHAVATINIYGEVVGIEVVAGGHGYTFAFITLVSDTGTGCVATPTLVADGPIPEDLNVMISATAQATAGAIEFIDIVEEGQNYSANSQFFIEGDGEGATLSVVINSEGGIASIQTENMGSGYTYANIVSTGTGEGAVFKPIISPARGHGGNVPTELLATMVGIAVDVQSLAPPSTQGDFFVGNDFRQVGVVKNIREYGIYRPIFVEDTGDSCHKIEVTDLASYNIDDIIVSNEGGRFVVVEKNPYPETAVVKLLPLTDLLTVDSVLTNETTNSPLAAIVSLIEPEINTKSGDIIYLKNTVPYTRQQYQMETVKLYLQF